MFKFLLFLGLTMVEEFDSGNGGGGGDLNRNLVDDDESFLLFAVCFDVTL